MPTEGAANRESPWIPEVLDGRCHQKQPDGTWIPCSCGEGQACGFDGGEQHRKGATVRLSEACG